MSGPLRDQRRWRLARLVIWMGILGAMVIFWVGVGTALLAWLRVSF